MMQMNRSKKRNGQSGFIVTAELLLITVILVIGLVTGMTKLRDQTIAELSDTGDAIGSINQSYAVEGTLWRGDPSPGATIAETAGWQFSDVQDPAYALGTNVGGDTQYVRYQGNPLLVVFNETPAP